MPKIAHLEPGHAANVATSGTDKLTKVAAETTKRAADAARESMQVAERTATAIGERQQETVRQSAKGATELSQLFMTLFNEQTRHNLQLATAFGRAVNWADVALAQSDFVHASFGRMSQLSGRYREIVLAGMKSMAFTART